MKKGISYWTFTGDDIKENLRLAKAAGFDGVELTLDAEVAVTLNSTKEQILEIKEYGEALGLEFYSVACSLYWTYNYTSVDKNNRSMAKKITKKQLEIASSLVVILFWLFRGRLKWRLIRAKLLNMILLWTVILPLSKEDINRTSFNQLKNSSERLKLGAVFICYF